MSSVVYSSDYIANSYLEAGVACFRQNRFRDAIKQFDSVIDVSPSDPYAHWNRATALLSLGEYEKGFIEYDWAWKLFDWRGFGPIGNDDVDRLNQIPLLETINLMRDKNLLVYHEMGFGDGIMMMRYLLALRYHFNNVTLVINPCLMDLAKRFGVEVVSALPTDVSHYHYRLPFFGCMKAFGHNLDAIPRKPYIMSSFDRQKNCVGIAWSGRTQNAFSLDYFLAMFEHHRFSLFSLQAEQTNGRIRDLPDTFTFEDTVKVIENLDHVVTVDTAAAHLAGAMGHPSVHLLLPYLMDWRWHHSRVWYPTIKTYRQTDPNDWQKPFDDLNQALRDTK